MTSRGPFQPKIFYDSMIHVPFPPLFDEDLAHVRGEHITSQQWDVNCKPGR